jgi:hypothetical protein
MTWGCYNRPPLVETYGKCALDSNTGQVKYYEIKNVMSKECQYTLRSPDPKCGGCKHEKRQ